VPTSFGQCSGWRNATANGFVEVARHRLKQPDELLLRVSLQSAAAAA